MNLINHTYDATAISIARAATIKGNRVEWDTYTYVTYEMRGNMISIKSIHTGIGEWETIYFSDKFQNLKNRYKALIAAAMIALNKSTAKVGESLVTFLFDMGCPVEQNKPEPLTNQPYAISGHRIEKDPLREETHVNINVPTIKVKGKGAWLLGAGICIAAVASIAIAAGRN